MIGIMVCWTYGSAHVVRVIAFNNWKRKQINTNTEHTRLGSDCVTFEDAFVAISINDGIIICPFHFVCVIVNVCIILDYRTYSPSHIAMQLNRNDTSL